MQQKFTTPQKHYAQYDSKNSKKPDFKKYFDARLDAERALNAFTFTNPATKKPDRLDNCLSTFYQLHENTTSSARIDEAKQARERVLDIAALVPFFDNVPVEDAAKGLFGALGCNEHVGAMHAKNLAKELLNALQPQQANDRGHG